MIIKKTPKKVRRLTQLSSTDWIYIDRYVSIRPKQMDRRKMEPDCLPELRPTFDPTVELYPFRSTQIVILLVSCEVWRSTRALHSDTVFRNTRIHLSQPHIARTSIGFYIYQLAIWVANKIIWTIMENYRVLGFYSFHLFLMINHYTATAESNIVDKYLANATTTTMRFICMAIKESYSIAKACKCMTLLFNK